MRFALAASVVAAGTALADVAPTAKLEVEVGQTAEVDVSTARGLICDDPSVVRGGLVTRNDRNFFVATGLKLGRTLCRVGTYAGTPPWYLFEVVVVPAKKR